jgi:hypothetical protein
MKGYILFFMGLFLSSGLKAGEGFLYTRYLQAQVIEQVYAQKTELTEELSEAKTVQVTEAFDTWRKMQLTDLRTSLEQQLGENAKSDFQGFVNRYREADASEDPEMLQNISSEIALHPPAVDYADLRNRALKNTQLSLLPEAARFLSEVQTWTTQKDLDVPLSIWLQRDQPSTSSPQPTPKPVPTVNPLQAAEAGGSDWVPPTDDLANPMDAFTQRRQEKREQAMEDAHAGMRQVASERESYEREQASKELAKAQADAEAMRSQAQRLAATEEEALAQRENSWGNRLKRIVGGTISAATGAFTGGIGAEAGQRAANAVFN